MIHCGNNLKAVKTIYERRNADQAGYVKLIAHAATCASCARNLQTLKDEELRQCSTPQPVKLRFDGKENRRR